MANRPNKYIQDVFTVLKAFNDFRKQNETERVRARERYMPAVAAPIIEQAVAACTAQYNAAKGKIDEIIAAAVASVDAWAVLDPAQITADSELLTDAFDLTSDELRQLVKRNFDNYTMIRMITDYANRHVRDEKNPDTYIDIPTAEKKRGAYESVRRGAVSLLDTMYNAPVVDTMLDCFCDADSPVSAQLYTDLGITA